MSYDPSLADTLLNTGQLDRFTEQHWISGKAMSNRLLVISPDNAAGNALPPPPPPPPPPPRSALDTATSLLQIEHLPENGDHI